MVTPHEHEVISNERDLRYQVEHLDSIQNKDFIPLLIRIEQNVQSDMAKSIAVECINLYKKTGSRDSVKSFLLIALDVDAQVVKEPSTTAILANPASFQKFTYWDLCNLTHREAWELKRLLKALPYKQYLRTPYWQAVRYEVLRLAGFACVRCGATTELNVHHIDYAYVGEDHRHLDNLVVLCQLHHLEWHMVHD